MRIKRFFALIITLTVAIGIFYAGCVSLLKTLYPLRYEEYVEVYAKENNLSPTFVYAVIKCESGFDSEAVSYVGATGLMQIMPDTFAWIKTKTGYTENYSKATDAETSIKFGCFLYGYLLQKYSGVQEALAAYHAGIGNADKWLKDKTYSHDGKTLHTIPFSSTDKYVKKVMLTEKIYQNLYFRKEK